MLAAATLVAGCDTSRRAATLVAELLQGRGARETDGSQRLTPLLGNRLH